MSTARLTSQLDAQGCKLRAPARGNGGHHQAQRRERVHGVAQTQPLAQGAEPHHRAERQAGNDQEPRGQPVGGGRGLSPRTDRAGEHLRKWYYTWDEVRQGEGH